LKIGDGHGFMASITRINQTAEAEIWYWIYRISVFKNKKVFCKKSSKLLIFLIF
jgi:hypothetical protein